MIPITPNGTPGRNAFDRPAFQDDNVYMADYEFTVVIERDEDGRFMAVCPALQGCYTEGETEEEARELIADAIRLHIQDRIERGEPICSEVASGKVRVAV